MLKVCVSLNKIKIEVNNMQKIASFKDRLNEALVLRDVKPAELHRRTGISESTISQYRSGYAEPKKKKLQTIAEALSVDPAYLMGLDVSPSPPVRRSAKLAKDAKNDNEILKAYESADPKTQKAVRVLLGIE